MLDGSREQIAAHIRRVNSGFFQLRAPIHLREERKLEMLYEGRRIEAEVVYCQKQESGINHIGIRMTRNGEGAVRKELRLPVDVRATVKIAGSSTAMPARVIDMAQSGLGLRLPKEIPAGTSISVDLTHGIAFGEVRSCKAASKSTYRVGFWMEEFIYRTHANESSLARRSRRPGILKYFSEMVSRARSIFSTD